MSDQATTAPSLASPEHQKLVEQLSKLPSVDAAEQLNRISSRQEQSEILQALPLERAARICSHRRFRTRSAVLEQMPPDVGARFLNAMRSDNRTAIIADMTDRGRRLLLPQLKPEVRQQVERQLQYEAGTAGELMTTELILFRPELKVGEALAQVRASCLHREAVYACYVIAHDSRKLLGSISLRDLVVSDPAAPVRNIMRSPPVSVNVGDLQKDVAFKIAKYNLLAIPVVDNDAQIIGFVTVDDVIDVLTEEQTRTVLRMGAVEPGALEESYMGTRLPVLVKKRATWLVILFLGEMLTATAMGYFEAEIAKAVVLALFVPLIISSGGNSGSQATSLLIRALALREVTLGDWWRVLRREVLSGLALGLILGVIGALRITAWQVLGLQSYGEHWPRIATTVGMSLVGVVLWGSLSGAMLPFILKRVGLDPATSSAPFVATLVDVTGLVIYFTVAHLVLRGALL